MDKWNDILPVAFGAMLAECVVGVMALIAATALHPADYFAINATPEAFAKLGMQVVDLPFLSQEIGMDLNGRTGGAVTLAVGMSYIFTKVPWFSNLASYFFQFVVMFEAVHPDRRRLRHPGLPLPDPGFLRRVLPAPQAHRLDAGRHRGQRARLRDVGLSADVRRYRLGVGAVRGLEPADGLGGPHHRRHHHLATGHKRRYMLTCLIPLAYLFVTVNYAGYWMMRNVYFNSAAKGYNPMNGAISLIMLVLGR